MPLRRLISALTVLGLLGDLQFGVAPSAGATVFNMTSGADSGPGTFDAALTAARADSNGPHVIEFSPGQVVTKDTTESCCFGAQPLMINGNGSTVTGSGGPSRILVLVTDAAVVINDLTMTDTATLTGFGAVFNNGAGDLMINDSVISDHEGTNGAGGAVSQVSFSSVVNEDHSITRTVLLEPGADDRNCGSSLVRTTGYTYSTDSSCTGPGGLATGDVENGADPLLGQLRNNGGLTLTPFPLKGSPLVDTVPNGDCIQVGDQRGWPDRSRPVARATSVPPRRCSRRMPRAG